MLDYYCRLRQRCEDFILTGKRNSNVPQGRRRVVDGPPHPMATPMCHDRLPLFGGSFNSSAGSTSRAAASLPTMLRLA
jgi:hypothetical protein